MCMILDGYKRHMTMKKLSDQSEASYMNSIRYYFEGFKGLDLNNLTSDDIYKISKEDLENYLITMLNKDYTAKTKITRINGLSSLLMYLFEEENYEIEHIIKNLRSVKNKVRSDKDIIREFFDEHEAELFLDTVKAEKGCNRERNVCMFTMYLHTGMRLDEVRGLRHRDFKLARQELYTLGKGEKIRVLFLSNEIIDSYLKYTKGRKFDQDDFVFLSNYGTQISKRQIQNEEKKYLKLTGIDKHITVHALRRTTATLLLNNGVDLYSVQNVLGHESPTTTQLYAKMSTSGVMNAMNKNPLIKK